MLPHGYASPLDTSGAWSVDNRKRTLRFAHKPHILTVSGNIKTRQACKKAK